MGRSRGTFLILTVMALGAFGMGCNTASWTPVNEPPHKPEAKAPADVRFYSSEKPFQEYVEVGVIRAKSSMGDDGAMSALREEAAKRGCDGVLLNAKPSEGTRFEGTCIFYK